MQQTGAEVANPYLPHQSGCYQFLHGLPGFRYGHSIGLHARGLSAGVMDPLGRIPVSKIHVLQGNGEVHQIKVKVLHTQITEAALTGGPNVLGPVVGIPQFGGYPEFLTTDFTTGQYAAQPVTHGPFVAVIGCAVQMTIARRHRISEGRRDL